jgi:hypothetical protein
MELLCELLHRAEFSSPTNRGIGGHCGATDMGGGSRSSRQAPHVPLDRCRCRRSPGDVFNDDGLTKDGPHALGHIRATRNLFCPGRIRHDDVTGRDG